MGTAGSRRERLRCYGTTLCQAASGRHQDAGVWDMISGAWGFSESLCHRGTMSAWFSHFSPPCFPLLSYQQAEFTAKFPKTFSEILEASRCNQKCLHRWSWGTSRGAGTEPCFVQPCCCPVALWLPAMELPQCRRVWAKEELLCSSNPTPASEERKINHKVVCAVVQLLEDQSSWESIYYWMAFWVMEKNFKEWVVKEKKPHPVVHFLCSGVISWPLLFLMPGNVLRSQSALPPDSFTALVLSTHS